MSEKLSSTP